ncbi:LysR family transcriptional regulator [Phenylobacterium sp.]|uniref:LysR family transcriptional regulator n=1 Tax=Phenylobacterium sp. TaxID=1871053 RepID=UPI00356635B4
MDRLDELAVFVTILEAGSLTGAARRLGRSPAAVTRALAALEARARIRLVERTTRKLAPTEAGRRLADQARRVLADYSQAVSAEADGGPLNGRIAVTAPLVFGRRHVTPVVTAFLDAHPQVSVELALADRNLDLIDEHLDVAVRIGVLADSSLVVRKVGEVRRLTVAAPAYLARAGAPETIADLARHEIILTTGRIQLAEWRYAGPDGREKVAKLTPRLIVSDVDATLLAAREGHGIARPLSYQVAEDLAAGRLVRLLEAFEPAPLPVQLVTPSAGLTAVRVRAFLDHAASALAALPVVRPAG